MSKTKIKLTKDERKEHRDSLIPTSRMVFSICLGFIFLQQSEYAITHWFYPAFFIFFGYCIFLTGRFYRKYIIFVTPIIFAFCQIILQKDDVVLAVAFFAPIGMFIFFLSDFLSMRSFEKEKGIKHKW